MRYKNSQVLLTVTTTPNRNQDFVLNLSTKTDSLKLSPFTFMVGYCMASFAPVNKNYVQNNKLEK